MPPDDDGTTTTTTKSAESRARREARARMTTFNELAQRIGKPELASEWFDEDRDVDDVRTEVIEILSSRNPTPSYAPSSSYVVRDSHDRFREAAADSLLIRCGFQVPEERRRNIDSYPTLYECMRQCLVATGQTLTGTPAQLFARASMSHATGDFTSLLANVLNKAVGFIYDELPVTWNRWCRRGSSSNFQTMSRVGLSNFSQYELVPDGMPMPEGTTIDRGETGKLKTYGTLWRIGRQAVLNDDVGLLADMSRSLAAAGRRVPDDLLYGANGLAANSGLGPTMSDGNALFHTAHNNIPGSGTALGTTPLAAARTAMRRQRDQNTYRLTNTAGNLINVVPRILMVPAALEQTAEEIINGIFRPDPSSAGNQISTMNWIASLDLVVEPRLDDISTTAWYVLASAMANPSFEIAFLDGQETPQIVELGDSDANGIQLKAFIDVDAFAIDWVGAYRDPGS